MLLRSGLRVHGGPTASARSRQSWSTVGRNVRQLREESAGRRTNSRSRAGM